MKLRNKKTGEIIKWFNNTGNIFPDTLAELNEEWEDYEEPKDFWFIDPEVLIACESTDPLLCDKKVAIETMKQIGNYFETKEEAEKAVEKLKAWKRLKDKGFELSGCFDTDDVEDDEVLVMTNGYIPHIDDDILADLEIVFGGKE